MGSSSSAMHAGVRSRPGAGQRAHGACKAEMIMQWKANRARCQQQGFGASSRHHHTMEVQSSPTLENDPRYSACQAQLDPIFQSSLERPINRKKAHSGCQPQLGLRWGVGDMQGWRPTMEDAWIAMGSLSRSSSDLGLFGVFDGHGGAQAAKFCSHNLPRIIAEESDLRDAFLRADEAFSKSGSHLPSTALGPDRVGCTAVTCLIGLDTIICANAGDSRAVLSRKGKAIDMSRDHKPDLPTEVARIEKAGGYVAQHHVGSRTIHRVNGDLALSRSIGDFRFKKNKKHGAEHQIVTCIPDIESFARQSDDEFIVIACDGVWDVLSSQEVVDEVRRHLGAIRHGHLEPSDVVCKVLDKCLAPDRSCDVGTDNMTMILVVLDPPERREEPARLPRLLARLGGRADTGLLQKYR